MLVCTGENVEHLRVNESQRFAAVTLWFKPEALFLSANSNRSARAQMEEG